MEEGFYMFGGLHSDGSASNELWILKPDQNSLKWISADNLTSGKKPKPRYSHSLTYFDRENSLLITGGRNERDNHVYSDIYLLTLDTLNWIQVTNIGGGMIGRADHFCVSTDNRNDFVILGGVD